jgi:sugar O-acyltransferase (sialic acid O-acetyltransferase NeuD family)
MIKGLTGVFMKKVVIFGKGDFARLAKYYLTNDSPYVIDAFTVSDKYLTNEKFLGFDIVPFERIEQTHPPDQFTMFVAIGFGNINKNREEIYTRCKEKGYELISYVNSKIVSWGEISIGDNCFILENNVIQPFVKIGNDVVIWSGNHIGHDTVIGDHCFIASHAVISGNVRIDPNCFVGVNATIRDGITIASECVIGAGALILKSTKPNEVYIGKKSEPATFSSMLLGRFRQG